MKTREFFPCAGHDWCVRGEKTAVGALALVKPLVDIGLGGIGLFPAGVFMMKWANRRVFTMKCISGFDYNLKKCKLSVKDQRCSKGLHLCGVRGCHKNHPALDCPNKGSGGE